MVDPPAAIGRRLKRLRIALGFETQTAFADQLGIGKSVYNPFETGARTLTFEVACTIRSQFSVPLDWLFFGSGADQLPAKIYKKLQEAA